MAFWTEVSYFMLAGSLLLFVPVIMIAFFQAGFFGKWLKARSGRGKFVLIKIRGRLRDHFDYGEINGEFLVELRLPEPQIDPVLISSIQLKI